jgi:hypothetical protein
VARVLKTRIVNPAEIAVARQWLSSRHVIAATDTYALMEETFSVQLPLRESFGTAIRRVGGWCEMAASLRGREPGSRGIPTVGRRYQAAQ